LDAGDKVRGFEPSELGFRFWELTGLLPRKPKEERGGAIIGMGSQMLFVQQCRLCEALLLIKLEGLLFGSLGE